MKVTMTIIARDMSIYNILKSKGNIFLKKVYALVSLKLKLVINTISVKVTSLSNERIEH